MSVKVNIDEKTLNNLDRANLDIIFQSYASQFLQNKYLYERYTRKNAILLMCNEKDDTKLKPIIALESQLIDTATGYGLGKEVTYYDKSDNNFKKETKYNLAYGIKSEFIKKLDETKENAYLDKLLDIFVSNNIHSHDMSILRDCLISGSADEMVYTDTEGNIQVARVRDDSIAFYDNSIKPQMIGFCRKVVIKNPLTKDESNYDYELYTNSKHIVYHQGGDYEVLKYGSIEINNIPFVRYDIGGSYIAKLISEIRSYELVTGNTKKILNYNDDAILLISGYMFEQGKTQEEVDKAIEEFKTKGALFLDAEEGTKAEWLTKKIDDGANENHKKNLKDDIYTIAGTFNPANDNMVYQNTLSLMFKMYGLETKMVGYLAQIKKGFAKRCKLITNILNFSSNSNNFDSNNIDMTFTRNVPTNTNEELNLINQARDFLPLEELYKMVSFVENPQEMVQKWKAWQIEKAKLDIEIEKIRASATEQDIMPDRLSSDE